MPTSTIDLTSNIVANLVNALAAIDPWKPLYSASRKVIACATVIEELLPFLPADVPYEILDFGLHLRPTGFKKRSTNPARVPMRSCSGMACARWLRLDSKPARQRL